jgi:hypothetical protein
MKSGRRTLIVAVVVVIIGIVVLGAGWRISQPVLEGDENVVFTFGDYTFDGAREDLVVFAQGDIALGSRAKIDGDVVLISFGGGSVQLGGAVEGDLIAVGHDVTLDESSRVDGETTLLGDTLRVLGQLDDLTVEGKSLELGASAAIAGTIEVCSGAEASLADNRATTTQILRCESEPTGFTAGSVVDTVITSSVFTGIAALLVTIFPRHISQMEEAMRRRPRKVLGVGLAVGALMVGLGGAVLLTLAWLPPLAIVVTPVYALTALLLLLPMLAGTVTLSTLLGDALLRRLAIQAPPLVTALVGALVVSVPINLLGAFPASEGIAFLATLVVGTLGLGAALDTRLGTRVANRRHFVQG